LATITFKAVFLRIDISVLSSLEILFDDHVKHCLWFLPNFLNVSVLSITYLYFWEWKKKSRSRSFYSQKWRWN